MIPQVAKKKNTVKGKGVTTLLAIAMAGMAHAGFSQSLHADSTKTAFDPKPGRSWLNIRTGAGFNAHALPAQQTQMTSLSIEVNPLNNLSVIAGMVGDLYDSQTKFFATPQGMMKENYLCLKYSHEIGIGRQLAIIPYADAGIRRTRMFAANNQSVTQQRLGLDAGIDLQFASFLSFDMKYRAGGPAQGVWAGLGVIYKIR